MGSMKMTKDVFNILVYVNVKKKTSGEVMTRNYILLKGEGVRLMLHGFCGIGMSHLHDNNLVQGWGKKFEN